MNYSSLGEICEKTINVIKLLVVLNPVIVILFIYKADFNYPGIKGLIAGMVMILCILEYALLDKLNKNIE